MQVGTALNFLWDGGVCMLSTMWDLPAAETSAYWVIVLVATLPYPLIYLSYRRVLHYKLQAIRSLMQPKGVVQEYMRRFGRVNDERDPTKAQFDLYYHWRSYALAIFFDVAVIAAGIAAGFTRMGVPLGFPPRLASLIQRDLPVTSLAGFAGAYILNLYYALRRYRTADLSPASMHFGWLHITLAAVMSPLFSNGLRPLAFGIGIFPIRDSLDVAKNFAKNRLSKFYTKDRPAEPPTLHKLQGMTAEVVERLFDEGISSAEQLAYADPIKLLLRSNIEFVVIIDLMDQALLFLHVGDDIQKLRAIGIRGAMEVAILGYDLEKHGKGSEEAKATVSRVASRLRQTPEELTLLIRTLKEDGQVNLLWDMFEQTLEPDEDETSNPHAVREA
jgi:hypothetical protein